MGYKGLLSEEAKHKAGHLIREDHSTQEDHPIWEEYPTQELKLSTPHLVSPLREALLKLICHSSSKDNTR